MFNERLIAPPRVDENPGRIADYLEKNHLITPPVTLTDILNNISEENPSSLSQRIANICNSESTKTNPAQLYFEKDNDQRRQRAQSILATLSIHK